MAVTYFGSASTPADGDFQAGPGPVAVAPPASMAAGDLVVIAAQLKSSSGTEYINISEAGGQSWTSETEFARAASSIKARKFWCRFDGTWTADPSVVVTSATTALTVTMHVFRPTSGSNTWAIDVAQVSASGDTPSTPFTATITGIETLTDGALVIATWISGDDNTWDSLTAGWSTPGSAQYRNTTGADQSITSAYIVKASAGATGNVSKNQATLGGDAFATAIIAFKEVAAGGGSAEITPTIGSLSASSAASRNDRGIFVPTEID